MRGGRRELRIGTLSLFVFVFVIGFWVGADADDETSEEVGSDFLIDEPVPFLEDEDLAPRTAPLIEVGPGFLAPGELGPGIELPTGAVWTPSLWIYGTFRTAVDTLDNGARPRLTEWANRLDIFANVQLSGTERVLFGMRPLDDDNEFSGYTFEPDSKRDNSLNGDITTLFFEGDFGEIFPNLDPMDEADYDIGFSVGRQPILFQDGILINDSFDSIGVSRTNIPIPGTSGMRLTGLFGWNDINRDNNQDDSSAYLFGLFSETDLPVSTLEVDVAYVDSNSDPQFGGDQLNGGVRAVQRLGHFNTSFSINGSHALDQTTEASSDGVLLFTEISTEPTDSEDILYFNGFWGIDEFASASRGPDVGGPLGRAGLLFAAVGLGRYTPALGNRADDAVGGSIGYQMFWNQERTQVVLETGGRASTNSDDTGAVAFGGRFEQKIFERFKFRLDGYVAEYEDDRDFGFASRAEILVNF